MPDACLDEARASAFVAGDLAPQLRQTIEDHVDDCPSCRALLAVLVRRSPSEATPTAAPAWPAGHRVGRYVIREPIGRGGMGTVFRADDVELGRAIALKRLEPGVDSSVLLREARAAAQLSHPNVVTVYEVGEADGAPFLAMELVEGATLAQWLRAEPRSWREIVAVLAQAGRGLAAAHGRGLVHRDFKPDNVLVDRSGRARVADFGLARVAPEAAGVAATASLARTTAALAGTPAYLAPELIDGAAPDAQSDQYAFGVTMFEALYGTHPFAGTSAEALWSEMAAGRIRDVDRRRLPARLDRHVRRALAIEPGARWPSVAALVDALERAPRRRWPYVAGAVVVAANIAWVLVPTKGDDCERAAQLVDHLWTPAIREAQALRLAAAAPHRDGAIATANQLVDDWTDAWRLGQRAACHVEPAQRAARQSCLDRDLAELRAQLAVWAAPTTDTVDRVVATVAALPRPDDCTTHPPPIAHAPRELEDRIANITALTRAGRPRDARPALAPVLAAADATGDAATIGRALAAAGAVERQLGDRDHAHDHDARAARESARAGDDAMTLAAMLEEAQVAIDRGNASEALGLCDAADALVARAHLDREDRVAVARGDALRVLGRTPEAIAEFRKAIAILEPRAARDRVARIDLAAVLGATGSTLGTQQFKPADARDMLLRSLAIEEVELGREHPEVARTLHDLANQELELGRLDDAAAHYTRARAIFAAAYGEKSKMVGGSDVGLGHIARTKNQFDDARRYYERARTEMTGELPADHPELAVIEEALAWVDRDEDKPRAAIPHFSRAIAMRERAGMAGTEVADDHVELGSALYELDRNDEARVEAERALALMETIGVAPTGRCNGWLLLSELEARAGHRARAIEIARKIVTALEGATRDDMIKLRELEVARIAELSR